MDTQVAVGQLRTFLKKVEENPYLADRLKPAAQNLLRLARAQYSELGNAIAELEQWLKERTA